MTRQQLKRAKKEGTPLIDGDQVTFVWQGKSAPQLIGDFNGWGWLGPYKPIDLIESASGIWTHTLTLPENGYFEYTFMADFEEKENIHDPFNKRLTTNGSGKFNNYFATPGYQHTRLVRTDRGIAHGTVTKEMLEHDFFIDGGKRDVYFYQPPTTEPSPLLVVFDGNDYVRRARLPQIVDNLIAQGRIRPIAMAMPAHGKQARFIEYNCNDSTVVFIASNVLEAAKQHLNLLDIQSNPGAYATLGASMGGLISLYTALRLPQMFGNVLSQSGAFGFNFMDVDSIIYDLVKHYQGNPLNIWMDVGKFEWLLDANRKIYPLLQANHKVTYREYSGAHNYTCWRDDIEHGLVTIFGKEKGER